LYCQPDDVIEKFRIFNLNGGWNRLTQLSAIKRADPVSHLIQGEEG